MQFGHLGSSKLIGTIQPPVCNESYYLLQTIAQIPSLTQNVGILTWHLMGGAYLMLNAEHGANRIIRLFKYL